MPKKAARLNRGWPTIVIVNKSSNIGTARLRLAIAAVQKQVDHDFFPVWGWRAKLRLAKKVRPGLMSVTLQDKDPEGAGGFDGYHVDDTGIPSAAVLTLDDDGEPIDDQSIFATLSHEVLEMIADPALNLYASAYRTFRGRRHRVFVGIEVCDAVQYCFYKVGGIQVSDFVVPEWFESERKPDSMRFSFKGNVTAPLQLAAGGYMDVVIKGQLTQRGAATKKTRHRLLERRRLLQHKR